MTLTADHIQAILQQAYPDLGRVIEVVSVNAGNISKTFRVTTASASVYILKAKPDHLFDPKATAAMHHYLAFLQDHDLPVPAIVKAADGSSFVQEGSTLYEVQTYIPHEGNLDDHEYADVSAQVSALLGCLHRISLAYPHVLPRVAYLGDSKLPIGLFAKYFDGALDHAIPRGIESAASEGTAEQALLDNLTYFADTLRALRREMERKTDTMRQVVNHNDIYGNNLLFREGQLVGLIDFDFCMTDVYYLDLVEALHYSALLQRNEKRYFCLPPDGEIRVGHALDDLRTYLRENPDLVYDGTLLAQLLMAKIISLALFPLFELYPQVEERLEMYRRVRRVVENLQDLRAFEV